MGYTKRIVCLANSVKIGGLCIAGKEVIKGGYGGWVRPVSARPSAEVKLEECWYENRQTPRLLDIVDIRMVKAKPDLHQTENHVIETGCCWEKSGTLPWGDLDDLVDEPVPLWIDGEHTFSGLNDCVAEAQAATLTNSLVLIKPKKVTIQVGVEGGIYKKRAVRAYFKHCRMEYGLKVTDPGADAAFRAKGDGSYSLRDVFLCVSLTEPYEMDHRCHKLVAAIISNTPF
jgi:hypothetical protein